MGEKITASDQKNYWRANVRLLIALLTIWFIVSFGAGILFVEPLNTIRLGGYPLGFWFAQQGAIYVFVGLIFYYTHRMRKIDASVSTNDEIANNIDNADSSI